MSVGPLASGATFAAVELIVAGDPAVAEAFALGWQMGELAHPVERRRSAPDAGALPTLDALDDATRVDVLTQQVRAALHRLAPVIEEAGLAPVEVPAAVRGLGGALHRELLATLTAADFRVGKAYGLGAALAGTCLGAMDLIGLRIGLGVARVAELLGWLDDLSTALPPHAAHSVADSLARWRDAAASSDPKELGGDPVATLRRQGELWRGVLSGEKAGTDLLEAANYVEAAGEVAERMRLVLLQVGMRVPWLAGGAAVLIALAVVLLAIGSSSTIVAGAASLLAAFGVTWKGFGTAAERLGAQIERPVWGAVLDRAIADAVTLLPSCAPHDHRRRIELAAQMSGSDTVTAPITHRTVRSDPAAPEPPAPPRPGPDVDPPPPSPGGGLFT